MQVLYECCCGLDVHKKTVVACVLITSPNGQVHKQVRTFATTTADLLRYGQILASFIPSKPTRDLRDVVRYRKILVQERAREINRLRYPCWKRPTSSEPRWEVLYWARVGGGCSRL